MLKISPKPASAPPAIDVDDSEIVNNSGGNDRKLAKSDFTKLVRRVEKPSSLTLNTRRAFT